ncbi:nitroreductase family protein [Geomonas agri]|uniref:nitroreductase family protein n=1 Tax=Geomonas agri TaxID=2873702 RepID=UPI001CD20457|nr:nitroreductase family protein [Geomonas agri]
MTTLYWDAIKSRRTHYAINNQKVTDDRVIEEIVNTAVQHVPSSFNSQSARVVILLGEQHERLWDLTKDELRRLVPPENFAATEEKIDKAFRSGYGSILFFEDQATIEDLQAKFPPYRENFPIWSQQSSGMLQFAIWTALESEGWGASLQHYNPVIDSAVRTAWGIDRSWKLIAQMPFGKPIAEPAPKEYLPLAQRVSLFR